MSKYKHPLLENLLERIKNVFYDHQDENWDGYGALPLKYLEHSEKFAKITFDKLKSVSDSLEFVPENDGCICFKWYISKDKYINISVKGNKLIYDYKIGTESSCGETNSFEEKMIFDKIKKVIHAE